MLSCSINTIGIFNPYQGRFDDALGYYRQTLDLYKLIGASRNVQQTEYDIEQDREAIKNTGR
ncbi:MAG: hypothetical protein HGB22_01125 [Chlorobiaceae bacterium]|nr:hypothetical protein [Chlorobiaceae bacterium]